MALREGVVRVSVPATSANLGPGFDALGLALDMRDRLDGEVLPEGLEVVVRGEGEGSVPLDETHLVVRSVRAALEALGEQAPGLRLVCHNVVPHARGLGSSSAAIVGGLALGRGLVVDGEERMDDQALLRLAADIEGHPDNVAPAALGGLVVAGRDDAGWYAVRLAVDPRVTPVVLVPPDGVETERARGLLPAEVPHTDAAANAGAAALLVAALSQEPDQLLRGTRDLLHQQYRRPAMPATIDLVEELRADGVAAVVSGAGPTVLALLVDADDAAVADVLGRAPAGWAALTLPVDARGVLTVLP